MSKNVCLLSIDPQYDFCAPDGKLSVPGADKDMERLAAMVNRIGGDLEEIVVTLDSHRVLHVAHPLWWSDKDGNHPDPFTLINVDDVTGTDPKWRATNRGYQDRSVEYVKALQTNGRYVLCIWPPHCLIASKGYQVMPVLFEALCAWEEKEFAAVNYVTKGSNMFTEHYSAIIADVVDPEDTNTQINSSLIKLLAKMDLIGISGEASSHCVASTVTDVANNFGEDNIKKFVYLEDTSSAVPGFENLAKDFVDEMTGRGMQVTTSDKFLR